MEFYFLGSKKFNQPQADPSKSLGGMISSSEIPNDVLNNLFGTISNYGTYQPNQKEYRAIAIYNETLNPMSNLKMWINWNSSQDSDGDSTLVDTQFAGFGIGYQAPTVDACGDINVPAVPSIYARPQGVTFSELAISPGTAISLPTLASDMFMVVWIYRKILPEAKTPLTTDQLTAISNGTMTLAQAEDFQLNFSWS